MEAWLKCFVGPGQFSDEFAVKIKLSNGLISSLFASSGDVQVEDQNNEGEVRAKLRITKIDEKDDLALIQLPHPTFENGQTITVKKTQLIPA